MLHYDCSKVENLPKSGQQYADCGGFGLGRVVLIIMHMQMEAIVSSNGFQLRVVSDPVVQSVQIGGLHVPLQE